MEETTNAQTMPTKKSNWVWPILALVVLGGGLLLFTNQKNNSATMTPQTTVTATQQDTSTSPTETAEMNIGSPIAVEGGMLYFKPNEIRVKKGEKVTITFTNVEGMHDFIIDEFNAKTKIIRAGMSETIEFTPDKVGEFEFYCSVMDHRQQGMVGKLIVED